MDDEALMEEFQAGTLEAFEVLVDRYEGRLTNYLYRFTGKKEASLDLLQETLLRVYQYRFSYKHIAKLSTWIFTIAGNLARAEYRRRKQSQVTSLQAVSREGEAYEFDVVDESSSPEEDAENSLQAARLQEALGSVPEPFREVVVLRDLQELSYEEVAQVTGLPQGSVKSRINRERAYLRSYLSDFHLSGIHTSQIARPSPSLTGEGL